MALWVEAAKKNILLSAKKEFMEKGFLESSIRTIAEQAQTSPGSIYVRFGNKEKLFAYFVERHSSHIIDKMKNYLEQFSNKDKSRQITERKTTSPKFAIELLEYIYKYQDEFYLLICCSKGTKYEQFIEELSDLESEYTFKYLRVIDDEIKNKPKVTADFLHMVNRAFFDGFFEVVRHRFDKEKAIEHIEKLMLFYNAGWEKFLV